MHIVYVRKNRKLYSQTHNIHAPPPPPRLPGLFLWLLHPLLSDRAPAPIKGKTKTPCVAPPLPSSCIHSLRRRNQLMLAVLLSLRVSLCCVMIGCLPMQPPPLFPPPVRCLFNVTIITIQLIQTQNARTDQIDLMYFS